MRRENSEQLRPDAALLAAALPGLGHCYLGEWKRGVLVFAGVMGLFFGGMLIGGIDVIDRVEDKWWFVLQAGVGPTAFAVDALHQKHFKFEVREGGRVVRRTGLPDPSQNPGGAPARSTKSLGRVNEVGSLYAAMAGMLNVIALVDVLWRKKAPPERRGRGAAG